VAKYARLNRSLFHIRVLHPEQLLTHKDRLLRFGAELIFAICEAREVEVVILNQGEDTSFEEDLARDVLEIITVFSARLYGSRSRKNKKLLETLKKAVE
jgi:predicted site-specific integrase-resolvase